MTTRRSAWINRRGQAGAAMAIDQVLERQPQPGEPVQHLPDELIEDSPYQARQPFSAASLAELAQGMRAAGFQGVLIVRPHSDAIQRRRGLMQLVYGHRRRAAWRLVCAERGEPFLLPVVVREVSDEQMLLIGAQENLQRQDLDPVEEAQIVAWHERLFFDKNQAEIGALLGKSSDWVSVRSRIHTLPDALKERLRERPRAMKHMLELGALYSKQPLIALELAERVIHESLTVEALRTLIRDQRESIDPDNDRETIHNRRASATSVQDVTKEPAPFPASSDGADTRIQIDGQHQERGGARQRAAPVRPDMPAPASHPHPHAALPLDFDVCTTSDMLQLQEAVTALTTVAVRDDALSAAAVERAIERLETALRILRRIRAQHGAGTNESKAVVSG